MIISSSFVQHGYDTIVTEPCAQFERTLAEQTIELESARREFNKTIESIRLHSFIKESEDIDSLYIEAEGGFFAKVGNVVITLAKKFSEMCDKVIQKIKDIAFQMKGNEAKMKMLEKEHPEYSKEAIRNIVKDGGITFADMKSFSELDNEFYKIMKMAKDKDVDPNSFKGKCKEFEKKLKNNDTKLQTVAIVAGAAGTIFGLYKTISTIGKDVKEAKKKEGEMTGELYNQLKATIGKAKNEGNKSAQNLDVENMGKLELTIRMHNMLLNKKNAAIGHNVGLIAKFEMALARAIDKISSTKAAKVIAGDQNGNYRSDIAALGKKAAEKARKEKKEKNAERKYRAAQSAYTAQYIKDRKNKNNNKSS